MRNDNIILYNPAEKTKQSLIDDFVLRQRQFDQLFGDIKKSKMEDPEQHYLIIGQRGMGKTTLLYRLKYAIEDDQQLSKWLIPVSFPEEQYQIGDLAALWEYVGDYLEDYGYDGLVEKMQSSADKDYEETIYRKLTKALDEKGQKLILLIDNFGDLLNKFSSNAEKENKRLRHILSTDSHIRLIAASAEVLEHTYQYDKPFYEFFKTIRLEGLSKEDIIVLLEHLGDVYGKREQINYIIQNEPHRIEVLRRLTGGVIRTIAILFEVFIDSKDGEIYKDLEAILDRVSPLYKARMDDLKPQQQLIVDAVAKAWDAVTIKEILESSSLGRNKVPSKQVSSQLIQLADNGIIEKVTTTGKNNLYRISERFFNIWYLMRLAGRKDKIRVKWLVRFFEEWCSVGEMEVILDSYIKKLESGQYDFDSAYLKSLVFNEVENIDPSIKIKLRKTTFDFLKSTNLNRADKFLKEASSNFLFDKAFIMFLDGNVDEAIQVLNKADISQEDIYWLRSLISLHTFDFDFINSNIKKTEELITTYDSNEISEVFKFCKLIYYFTEGQYNQALALFEDQKLQEDFLPLKYWKGKILVELKNYADAELLFRQSINEGYDLAHIELGKLLLINYERLEEAESEFRFAEDNNLEAILFLLAISLKKQDFLEGLKLAQRSFSLGFKEYPVSHAYGISLYNLLMRAFKNKTRDESAEYYLAMVMANNSEFLISPFWKYVEANKGMKEEIIKLEALLEKESKSNYFGVVWNIYINNYNKANYFLITELSSKDYSEERIRLFIELFTYIAGNKLYHMLYEVFQRPDLQLKDKMKPFYYALMYFMQDEYPNEYLRAGEELRETIEEIVAKIKEWQELLKN